MNKQYRKPLIAGNWKMNSLPSDTEPFIAALKPLLPDGDGVLTAICAPYTHIAGLIRHGADCAVLTGAQDVSAHNSGAYTGEVSADMLKDLGVKYVIVGHSERRQYHNEGDTLLNTKVKLLLEKSITPIFCCGESLDQREAGVTKEFIAYQLAAGLAGLTPGDIKQIVIAYEPIWAIGTGVTATSEQAREICGFIRERIEGRFGAETANGIQILYGGSMNAKNAAELLSMPDIDGGLIGGASLKPEDFSQIIRAAAEG